jgi:hypothetical protein
MTKTQGDVCPSADLRAVDEAFTPAQKLRVEELVARACGKCCRLLREELHQTKTYHARAQMLLEASYAETATWKQVAESALEGIRRLGDQLFAPSHMPLTPAELASIAADPVVLAARVAEEAN